MTGCRSATRTTGKIRSAWPQCAETLPTRPYQRRPPETSERLASTSSSPCEEVAVAAQFIAGERVVPDQVLVRPRAGGHRCPARPADG